jgi:hypothetical protein
MRSGVRTSEFWVTVFSILVALLVSFGKPEHADDLAAALTNGFVGVSAFLTAAASVWKYIHSRTEIKTTHATVTVASGNQVYSRSGPPTQGDVLITPTPGPK